MVNVAPILVCPKCWTRYIGNISGQRTGYAVGGRCGDCSQPGNRDAPCDGKLVLVTRERANWWGGLARKALQADADLL